AVAAYSKSRSGVRCADTTRTSNGTSRLSKVWAAWLSVSQSDFEPMTRPTRGCMAPPPFHRGVPRPGLQEAGPERIVPLTAIRDHRQVRPSVNSHAHLPTAGLQYVLQTPLPLTGSPGGSPLRSYLMLVLFVYALTLFVSATLLFLVQPMIGKMIL